MATGGKLFGTFTALVAAWSMNGGAEAGELSQIRAELADLKGVRRVVSGGSQGLADPSSGECPYRARG